MSSSTFTSQSGITSLSRRAFLAALAAADATCAVSTLIFLELLQREIQPGWVMPGFFERIALLAAITVFVSLFLRRGRNWLAVTESSIARLVLLGLVISTAWLGADFMLTRGEGLPRQLFGRFAVALPVIMVAVHWAMAIVVRAFHLGERHDQGMAGTLVLGRAEDARLLIEYVLRQPGAPSFRVVGVVTDVAGPLRSLAMRPVLGALENLERVLERLAAERRLPALLVLATDDRELDAPGRLCLAQAVERYGLRLVNIAEALRQTLHVVDSSSFAGSTREANPPVPYRPGYLVARRAIDIGAASLGLLVAAVPMVVVASLISIKLGAPVLFRQKRVGLHGHPIVILKFRTMRFASTADGQILPDEARQTPFGRLLRRLRLDELPQLWNVLRGDISLVGPRPLVQEDIERLPDRGYLRSFLRPGLTGWAQLHGGQSLSDDEKYVLDAWYMKRANVWLDLWIILKTPLHLLRLERPCRATVARCRDDIRHDARRWTAEARAALGDRASETILSGQIAKSSSAA